jgi:FKBP-type peptidyl-prolyl cis-trans isomerase
LPGCGDSSSETAKKPKNGDTVSVNYVGTLDNGEEFDSSIKEGGSPLSFIIGN